MADICTKNLDAVVAQFRSILQKPETSSVANQRDATKNPTTTKAAGGKVKMSAASFIKNSNSKSKAKPSVSKPSVVQQKPAVVESQDVLMSAQPSSQKANRDACVKKESEPEADIGVFIPKNSVQVLNELRPAVFYQVETLSNKKIMATVTLNGTTYCQQGKTESIAKQNVAESVLKDLFFDVIMNNIAYSEDDNNFDQYNQDSWKLLGSFAMFKLIEDWLIYYMNETSCKDIFDDPPPSTTTKAPASDINNANDTTEKYSEIQNNNSKVLLPTTNYVSLLSSKLGNVIYNEMSINLNNQPPFRFSAVVDKVQYVGDTANSKKGAKQKVAKKVLMKKFGYQFVDSDD